MKKWIEKHIVELTILGLVLFIVGCAVGTIGLFVFDSWRIYLSCFPIVGAGYYLTFILCMGRNPTKR